MTQTRWSNHRFVRFLGDRFASSAKKGLRLLDALLSRDTRRAELLVHLGADLTAVDELGRTALHVAVDTRSSLIALLVAKGAHVDAKNQYGLTPLLAVLNHIPLNNRIAEELIGAGADVHASDEEGRTPLHHVLWRGRLSLARLLVERGADVNRMDKSGDAALHYALRSIDIHDAKFHRLLIEKGADVNLPDQHGNTPLHVALSTGWRAHAELFARAGATVNPGDPNNGIDLVYAAKLDLLPIARVLVAKGAPLDAKDKGGSTALGYALAFSHLEIARLLIDSGADVNASFNERDGFTNTPAHANHVLHLAVGMGHSELVRAMLEKGSDVNARDRAWATPLIRAARANNRTIVALLLSASADVRLTNNQGRSALAETTEIQVADLLSRAGLTYGRDANGETPLFSIGDEQTDYAGHLIRSGVDINARRNDGKTALILHAAGWAHPRVVRFLLDNGAEVNASSNDGTTALSASINPCTERNGAVALLLMERGADPAGGGGGGGESLRGAAYLGMESVVRSLLDHGVDPNLAGDDGTTPLIAALESNEVGCARLLLKHGADPNARDGRGRLALHRALEHHGSDAGAELLVSAGSVVDEEALTLASKNRLHRFLLPLLHSARKRGVPDVLP